MVDNKLLLNSVEQAFKEGSVIIKDHRHNVIMLQDGVFTFNDCIQPKSEQSIKVIFLEAFKLTRSISLHDKQYVRKKSKWIQQTDDIINQEDSS